MRCIKRYQLLLAVACLVGCSLLVRPFFSFKQPTLSSKLELISFIDRMYLEAFFRTLISQDTGSYVLFGSKPVSVMFNIEKEEGFFQLATYGFQTSFDREQKGFAVWQRYQHLFPLKQEYALIKRNFGSYSAIFLIHKPRLLCVLDQYFSDFRSVFPHFQSSKQLLEGILEDPNIIQKILDESDVLFGILLGFGKENAMFFQRKMELIIFLSSTESPKECYCNLPFFKPTPCSGFATLEEELKEIERRSDGPIIPEEDEKTLELMLHWALGFLVDTEKTDLIKLRAQLKQERIQATQAYAKGNFLEVTLQALVDESRN